MPNSSLNDDSRPQDLSQADCSYRCPKCGSNAVSNHYPEIQCRSCGYAEPLADFPISWDFYRHYSLYYTGHDPGPNLPQEHTLGELHERVRLLEEHLDSLSDEDLRRLGFRHIKEEIDQLKLGLHYTQRLIPRKPAGGRAPKRAITTEV